MDKAARLLPERGTLFTSKYANRTGNGLPIFTTERAMERQHQVKSSRGKTQSLSYFDHFSEKNGCCFTRCQYRSTHCKKFFSLLFAQFSDYFRRMNMIRIMNQVKLNSYSFNHHDFNLFSSSSNEIVSFTRWQFYNH